MIISIIFHSSNSKFDNTFSYQLQYTGICEWFFRYKATLIHNDNHTEGVDRLLELWHAVDDQIITFSLPVLL